MNEISAFFETVLPNPLEKLLVFGSLMIGWYFIKDFKNKTESSLKEIEPLKYLIEMLRSDMQGMRETIDMHRDTLGKANKGIKGDFLDLRGQLIESTEKMNGLVNEVRYDFLDTQKDTVSIASKLELIIKDLDKKYGENVKLQDEIKEISKMVIDHDKEQSWIRSRVDQNKNELEKTKDSISKIIRGLNQE